MRHTVAHAACWNLSPLHTWEADQRSPDGEALRLLEIGRREPAVVFSALVSRKAPRSDVVLSKEGEVVHGTEHMSTAGAAEQVPCHLFALTRNGGCCDRRASEDASNGLLQTLRECPKGNGGNDGS